MEYFVISFNKGAACVVTIMAITSMSPRYPLWRGSVDCIFFNLPNNETFSPKKSINWRLNLEQLVQLFQFPDYLGLLALSGALVLESKSSLFSLPSSPWLEWLYNVRLRQCFVIKRRQKLAFTLFYFTLRLSQLSFIKT